MCQALTLIRSDVRYPGGPDCPVTSPGMLDSDWLPLVGANDWVVIMRDKRIRKRPGERDQLLKARVRAFCLTHAGNYSKWRTIDLLVRRWSDIEEKAATEPGPYIYSVTHAGLKKVA